MSKKHSPSKRTYKMLGRYDVEHGDLMKWTKRIIMVGALATAISGLGFNLEWPFYPRIDGIALAGSGSV